MTQENKYATILRAIADGLRVDFQTSNGEWVEQPHSNTLNELACSRYAPQLPQGEKQ